MRISSISRTEDRWFRGVALLLAVVGMWMLASCGACPQVASSDDQRDELSRLQLRCVGQALDEQACRSYVIAAANSERIEEARQALASLEKTNGSSWLPPYLLGELEFRAGRPLDSRDHYRRCLERARRGEAARGESRCLNRLGGIALLEHDAAEGRRLFGQALEAARRSEDPRLEAIVLSNLARLDRDAGKFHRARATMEQVVEALQRAGAEDLLRSALYNLGEIERQLGLYRAAERRFEEVSRLALAAGDRQTVVYCTIGSGLVLLEQEEIEQALALFDRAAAEGEELGEHKLAAHAALLAGLARIRLGRLDEAAEDLQRRVLGRDPSWDELRLRRLVYLAEAQRRRGHLDEAQEAFDEASAIAAGRDVPAELFDIYLGRAMLYRARGEHDAAVGEARAAVELVDGLRELLPDPSERARFVHAWADAYLVLAACLVVRDGRLSEEVFSTVEAAHARSLREAMNAAGIGRRMPRQVGLAGLQRRLRQGEMLVEFLLGEEESLLLAIGRDRREVHFLPSRRELSRRVASLRAVLLQPLTSAGARLEPGAAFRRYVRVGYGLFETLLGTQVERLSSIERLLIVPDRDLYLLPFDALPLEAVDGDNRAAFLGGRHVTEYLPSATFLARVPARERPQRVLLLMASSDGSAAAPRGLAFGEQEAKGVTGAYAAGAVTVVRGSRAVAAALRESRFEAYGVLHLIAHARYEPGRGPQLVLGRMDNGESRLVSAAEIASLGPFPPLVVLSACDTARGEIVAGEGILGFFRALTLAGARQLVAGLWPTGDADTARLMARFHHHGARGESPSRAMFSARREVMTDRPHPFNWAGFVVYGPDPTR